jgi:Fe-S cluster biogenesis protein NfuA
MGESTGRAVAGGRDADDAETDVQRARGAPKSGVDGVLSEVLAALVEADGGELYVVSRSDDAIALHLAGRFAGCPGNALASQRIIEPALLAVAPRLKISVGWGGLVPKGAERVRPPQS